MPFQALRHALLFVLLSCLAVSSQAAVLCVGTPTELQNALFAAAGQGGDASVEIRIRSGVYSRNNPNGPSFLLFLSLDRQIEISGGWTDQTGPCSRRGSAPTLLQGVPDRAILSVVVSTAPGKVTLRDLHVVDARGAASALLLETQNSTGEIRVERVVVHGAQTQTPAGLIVASIGSGRFVFRNNLISGNQASRIPGLQLLTTGGETTLVNNTFIDNIITSASSGAPLVILCGSAPTWVGNNVIAGTTGQDAVDLILCEGNSHVFSHNHYTDSTGTPATSIARTSGAAGFLAPGLPVPGNRSVLRNSGTLEVPGGAPVFDMDFVSRPQGGRIDRGAYEIIELFAHGFE